MQSFDDLRFIIIDFDGDRQINDLHELADLVSIILQFISPRQLYRWFRVASENRCFKIYASIHAFADDLCPCPLFILLPTYDKASALSVIPLFLMRNSHAAFIDLAMRDASRCSYGLRVFEYKSAAITPAHNVPAIIIPRITAGPGEDGNK